MSLTDHYSDSPFYTFIMSVHVGAAYVSFQQIHLSSGFMFMSLIHLELVWGKMIDMEHVFMDMYNMYI